MFVDKKCSLGYTALHYASFRGNLDLIESLIEYGANIEEKSVRGLGVLHLAAQGDRPEVIIYFKEKYKLNILQKDFNGSTPLHWACFMGSENVLNFLLSWMQDVNVKEDMGYTPLHLAVFSGKIYNFFINY
jgi:ankyrin repeat protein